MKAAACICHALRPDLTAGNRGNAANGRKVPSLTAWSASDARGAHHRRSAPEADVQEAVQACRRHARILWGETRLLGLVRLPLQQERIAVLSFEALMRLVPHVAMIVAAAILCMPNPLAAQDCGGAVPCHVEGGLYRVEAPRQPEGVLVWFHGYQGSANGEMHNRLLIEAATSRGLAFVAVEGVEGRWSFANEGGRDDIGFTGRVLDDIQNRFGVDGSRVVLGGFSLGASMAYYGLCAMGDRVGAGLLVSGSFWDPIPQRCSPNLPPLVQFHGTADRTFPLEGRALGGGAHQGDTFAGMNMLARSASCAAPQPPVLGPTAGVDMADLSCTVWPDCRRGSLRLCLHGGGHVVDPAMVGAGLTALGFPER